VLSDLTYIRLPRKLFRIQYYKGKLLRTAFPPAGTLAVVLTHGNVPQCNNTF